MVVIGTIPTYRDAKALCDYLKLKQIEYRIEHRQSQLDAQADEYEIYVGELNRHEAKSIFLEFVQDPKQKKFQEASWYVGQIDDTVAQHDDKVIWIRTGPFTKFITFICALIFALSSLGLYNVIISTLYFEWQLVEFYRFITPSLVHFSLLHLALGLSVWWFLAGRIERLLGTRTLIAVFIISAMVSNIAQATLDNTNFRGISGVSYALVGFAWYCGVIHKSNILFVPNSFFVIAVGYLLFGFTDILPVAMANWAHLGGLLSGLALAHVMIKRKKQMLPPT